MTLDEALNQMKTILGFRSDLATTGPQALKLAQEYYERGPTYPWFLVSEDSSIRTSSTDRRIRVPADFVAEYEEGALYYDKEDGSDLIQLVKKDLDYLTQKIGSATTGEPVAYSTDGLYFNIYPMPDDLYKLWMKYYRHDAGINTLSGSTTNLWLTYAPDCIIGRAGGVLASGLRDVVAAAKFKDMEMDARVELNIQNEDRKHSNRVYQVGGPH
jgi:hypothetical protein